jgi:hypothetical protein
MTFLRQRQRDHGGFKPSVPQGELDEAEVDAGCEERGGGSMSEGMAGHTQFGKASAACGGAEGPLDAVAAHGKSGGRTLFVIPPGGRKAPGGVVVGFPIGPEHSQSVCGQRNLPVLGARASMDLDDHTLRVNVGTLKGEGFVEPESQAVDGGAGDLMGQGCG